MKIIKRGDIPRFIAGVKINGNLIRVENIPVWAKIKRKPKTIN